MEQLLNDDIDHVIYSPPKRHRHQNIFHDEMDILIQEGYFDDVLLEAARIDDGGDVAVLTNEQRVDEAPPEVTIDPSLLHAARESLDEFNRALNGLNVVNENKTKRQRVINNNNDDESSFADDEDEEDEDYNNETREIYSIKNYLFENDQTNWFKYADCFDLGQLRIYSIDFRQRLIEVLEKAPSFNINN